MKVTKFYSNIAKPLLGLYLGCRNGKVWRGFLGDKMHKVGIGSGDLLRESLQIFDNVRADTA